MSGIIENSSIMMSLYENCQQLQENIFASIDFLLCCRMVLFPQLLYIEIFVLYFLEFLVGSDYSTNIKICRGKMKFSNFKQKIARIFLLYSNNFCRQTLKMTKVFTCHIVLLPISAESSEMFGTRKFRQLSYLNLRLMAINIRFVLFERTFKITYERLLQPFRIVIGIRNILAKYKAIYFGQVAIFGLLFNIGKSIFSGCSICN